MLYGCPSHSASLLVRPFIHSFIHLALSNHIYLWCSSSLGSNVWEPYLKGDNDDDDGDDDDDTSLKSRMTFIEPSQNHHTGWHFIATFITMETVDETPAVVSIIHCVHLSIRLWLFSSYF